MKRCDNCQNEATVFYQVTINGKTEQKHLCAECAKKEGVPMDFDLFEPSMSIFGDRFFETPDRLFAASSRLFDEFERPGGLFGGLFALPKTLSGGAKAEEKTDAKEAPDKDLTPLDEAPKKSLAALKAELKRALKQEDYLRAAALRDEIRALEGSEKHEK